MLAHGTSSFVPFHIPLLLSDDAAGRITLGGEELPSILESTNVDVTNASTLIWKGAVSGNSWFQVTIVNDGENPVYLNVLGGAAEVGKGIRLNPNGGTYTQNNQHFEAIHGITSAGESNVTLTVA